MGRKVARKVKPKKRIKPGSPFKVKKVKKLTAAEAKYRRRVEQYGWGDPCDHYIYNPTPVTIRELHEIWKAERGASEQWLKMRCADEGWVSKRKKHFNDLFAMVAEESKEKLASEMADNVVDANKRHIQYGRMIQAIASKLIKFHQDSLGELKIGEAMRLAIKAAKDGVDIERKALGLADQVVRVQFTKDVAKETIDIITKYIQDPNILENIVRDLDGMVDKQSEILQEQMEPATIH
jgi:hypothetical protein